MTGTLRFYVVSSWLYAALLFLAVELIFDYEHAVVGETAFFDPGETLSGTLSEHAVSFVAWIALSTIPAVVAHRLRRSLLAAIAQVETVSRSLEQTVDQLAQLQAETEQLAATDHLTALANRRAFDAHLESEIRTARALHRPLAVSLYDLDGFKGLNDQHGHQAGDAALRAVAGAMRSAVRRSDVVARIGGDEFAIIHTGASAADAAIVAGKVIRAIVGCGLGSPLGQVTASAGVAQLGDRTVAADVVRAADAALYEAKSSGRAKVIVDDNEGVDG